MCALASRWLLSIDEDRENEGDLVIAAQEASAENINFMMQEGKGLICLSLTSDVLESSCYFLCR